MKRFLNLAFYPVLGILIFNFFFRDFAQASGALAYEKLSKGEAIILDVREKDEVSNGMIKGAEWIPLSALKSDPKNTITKLKKLISQKELYIYCRSGARANTFFKDIKEHGIEGKNLGGYSDLVAKGLPSEAP
jgi:rhodanese-related sulfurtransferase